MGGKSSSMLSLEDLDEFCALTYFNRKEILHLFQRFYQINPAIVKSNPLNIRLPAREVFDAIQELKHNPFQERLVNVFSSQRDNCFSFDDFVDLASAFCEKSPADVRASFAFRIYDFDNDGYLTATDLAHLIDYLTCSYMDNQVKLNQNDLNAVVGHILNEAGLENNNSINEMEFKQLIKKLPDFSTSFKFRL